MCRTEEKTTEFNLRSGKSEAEVRLMMKDCARGIVLLNLATDRHEASLGLSATAGILVMLLTITVVSY